MSSHIYTNKELYKRKKFDYFIEDNLDIVTHVAPVSKTKVLWIYNILDRRNPYTLKYPYLKKALEQIQESSQT